MVLGSCQDLVQMLRCASEFRLLGYSNFLEMQLQFRSECQFVSVFGYLFSLLTSGLLVRFLKLSSLIYVSKSLLQ